MSIVVGVGSLASGRLTARFGPRPPMISGLLLAAAGAALLATTGAATSLWLVIGGSLLLGLVSLAMLAMTAAVVGAAGPEHAGVASGILNRGGPGLGCNPGHKPTKPQLVEQRRINSLLGCARAAQARRWTPGGGSGRGIGWLARLCGRVIRRGSGGTG